MSNQRYSPEFKDEAVRQIVDRGYSVVRPNALCVADLIYVAIQRGFAYVAFFINAFARRNVGWRVSGSLSVALALDVLEQALYDREISPRSELIHHSDRGVQYLSIRYTERLCEVGIRPSVGRVGDSYDNALAETVIGLFKTEVIRQQGPWKSLEDVEFATLAWVDWFNNKRLLVPIRDMPPVGKEGENWKCPPNRGHSTQTNQPPVNPGRFSCVSSSRRTRSSRSCWPKRNWTSRR